MISKNFRIHWVDRLLCSKQPGRQKKIRARFYQVVSNREGKRKLRLTQKKSRDRMKVERFRDQIWEKRGVKRRINRKKWRSFERDSLTHQILKYVWSLFGNSLSSFFIFTETKHKQPFLVLWLYYGCDQNTNIL